MPYPIASFTPEIILAAAAVAILFAGAWIESARLWSRLALLAVGGSIAAFFFGVEAVENGLFAQTLHQFRAMALLFGGLLIAMRPPAVHARNEAESVASLLILTAGMSALVLARDFALLFVALELISIPTYILLYLGQNDSGSREAAVKYFFLSVLASAILLYGFSFLYGATGTVRLEALASPVAGAGQFILLGVLLCVAGLGFRIAAVPFHFYVPDVFQGTSHANAALLSVVPKAAGIVVLAKIVHACSAAELRQTWQLIALLAIVTMTWANTVALWQENIRRLLAYSSIAHAGYMLLGLAVAFGPIASEQAEQAFRFTVLYWFVYSTATVGLFAAFNTLGRPDRPISLLDELAGLARLRPMIAIGMVVCVLSLAGLPPLVGFFGKLGLFWSAIDSAGRSTNPWFFALAVAGAVNTAIGAVYYLRIAAMAYFQPPLGTQPSQPGLGARLTLLACALATVLLPIALFWSTNSR